MKTKRTPAPIAPLLPMRRPLLEVLERMAVFSGKASPDEILKGEPLPYWVGP